MDLTSEFLSPNNLIISLSVVLMNIRSFNYFDIPAIALTAEDLTSESLSPNNLIICLSVVLMSSGSFNYFDIPAIASTA